MKNGHAKRALPAIKIRGAASAAKLLGVVLCFSPDRPHWTVPELCSELDVSQSTMYRYIALLREAGLLEFYRPDGYRLSTRFFTLASAARMGRSRLDEISLPVITAIRDRTDETVLIARRHRDFVYCVERADSSHAVRLQFSPGQPMSLHLGAAARVLLAFAPVQERNRYLASIADKIDARTARLLSPKALGEIVKQGYTESFGEVDEGIWGSAAAIVDNDQVVGALAIAAPIFRTNQRTRKQLVAEVRQGAKEVIRLLQQDSEQQPGPPQRRTARPIRRRAAPALAFPSP
ncbi:MAG TPA: IclR family transcriptional regulator [Xanthobacteraceae bacterium]